MDAAVTDDFQQILPIEQLRSTHASNDYVERPPAPCKQALSSPSLIVQTHKSDWSLATMPTSLPRSLSQCHQLQPLPQHLSQSSIASSMSHSTTASSTTAPLMMKTTVLMSPALVGLVLALSAGQP
uniref:cDNA FLJ43494 fis, clone PEBLM2000170, moderately similar to Sprouty homolog 3 n=1 Tax=Homo sapiens TaxID=9606 RepID=Q6ZUP3_HUMAN|nr:unnamed protein product [Homo sapiens]